MKLIAILAILSVSLNVNGAKLGLAAVPAPVPAAAPAPVPALDPAPVPVLAPESIRALPPAPASRSCDVILKSFDAGDTSGIRGSYISVDGVRYVDSTGLKETTGAFHVVQFDPAKCMASNAATFYTSQSAGEQDRLVAYIQNMEPGTRLLGVTSGDATIKLQTMAREVLGSIGLALPPIGAGFGEKLVFYANKAAPLNTVTKTSGAGKGSLFYEWRV
jgi:hypothetical protein